MAYYFAGYYLLRLKRHALLNRANQFIRTCSSCINDHLISDWSYSCVKNAHFKIEDVQSQFNLSNLQLSNLRKWADQHSLQDQVGWNSLFYDIETALEYKHKFFEHCQNVHLLSMYIDEEYRQDILEIYKPAFPNIGEVGLYACLKKVIVEPEDTNELLLGYDYIGIEPGGDFHSFHCHHLADSLCEKFNLELNYNNLFDDSSRQSEIEDFLNDESSGLEAVPWGIAKVKLVKSW
ncbi:hypothetical protein B9T33_14475 [Acinetobacter sp. ANC 5054]|uniref:hypothetical protein n=1 Tax=Acinetobacter sp. ANC 5054 TaxID=1977877 RepID=UPI000A34E098|nr:hypothetical protein [Acinetobacter sp. ANC 5054]OTG77994.1 hypothetical protein B9T33_14475 [Acinetobacter sp. ANC 5054]